MNQNSQHCFLLDGKTILPINHNHQFFASLKKLENKYCSCYQKNYRSYCQHSSNDKLKANNNNKQEDLCSCSLQSIEKLSEDKYRKIAIAKRNICKHQQINNNETC
jgi:hypothetical protein